MELLLDIVAVHKRPITRPKAGCFKHSRAHVG